MSFSYERGFDVLFEIDCVHKHACFLLQVRKSQLQFVIEKSAQRGNVLDQIDRGGLWFKASPHKKLKPLRNQGIFFLSSSMIFSNPEKHQSDQELVKNDLLWSTATNHIAFRAWKVHLKKSPINLQSHNFSHRCCPVRTGVDFQDTKTE
jgi:hypothetical protein